MEEQGGVEGDVPGCWLNSRDLPFSGIKKTRLKAMMLILPYSPEEPLLQTSSVFSHPDGGGDGLFHQGLV